MWSKGAFTSANCHEKNASNYDRGCAYLGSLGEVTENTSIWCCVAQRAKASTDTVTGMFANVK